MTELETSERIEEFTRELSSDLRVRFRSLAARVNGNGRPTAQQLTQCVMASAVEIQRHSPDYLEEWTFMDLMSDLKAHPEYGESIMPYYDACCNGKTK